MRASKRDKEAVRLYVEGQAQEEVTHVEKVASELVGPVRHDIWDVHCQDSRFWVVTEPMNLYDQEHFKSRDVVLTFHIGLSLRMSYLQDRQVPVASQAAELLPGSWRRWEQAWETFEGGDEAEDFQAVGMRLRECLVSFIAEVRDDDLVPSGISRPKDADVRGWSELLANHLASGESAAKLRSYLKKTAGETWDYVNWLTHAKNAIRMDAEIALKIVEHLLGTFTASRLRLGRSSVRCDACGSYRVIAGRCARCDWLDPSYQTPVGVELSGEERDRRLSTPCSLTSDIDTLVSPHDYLEPGGR